MQPERLNWALREILRRSSGLTQFPPGQGLWVDQTAHLYRDLVVPIQVALPLEQEGNEVWFEGAVSPMMEDSVIWVARDITERKRAQQALEQQVEREAVVNRISSAVRRSLDITEVFRTAVRELGTYLAVDPASVEMADRADPRDDHGLPWDARTHHRRDGGLIHVA